MIEASGSFLVFTAKEITATPLTASCLTVPKRSYDEWLTQHPVTHP